MKLEPRLYQQTIFATTTTKNTLVVLPTGLGKTLIALMLAKHRLKQYPNSKILFLAPTKPLVQQHYQTFLQTFKEDDLTVFTGGVPPLKRQEIWSEAKIFFSTPQGLENDIINERINLKEVSLIVFDEAHRAVGDYAYVFVARQYHKIANYERILALSASPGSDNQTIQEVIDNLLIEAIEVRDSDSPDVKSYIQKVDINWEPVELTPTLKRIQKTLQDCYNKKVREIKKTGLTINGSGKLELLKLQGQIQAKIRSGEKNFEEMQVLSISAQALKIQHALELIETQGITPLYEYIKKIQGEALTTSTKATKNLASDIDWKTAYAYTTKLYDANVEHPKFQKLKSLLENTNQKTIIFTQYRDTAKKIKETLDNVNITSKIFVGQAKKKGTGLTQKEQKKIIEEFKNNEFDALIATSVAEEGLDIPAVDNVIFFEPVPSAIRTVQRRGRTGRLEKGIVTMIYTKGTRDEAYKWSSHHKEKRMHRSLSELKNKLVLTKKSTPTTLEKYTKTTTNPKIIVDYREKSSAIVKELLNMDCKVKLEQLIVGDYVVSEDCAIEFKTKKDFVDSIVDGRLLEQVKQLKKHYRKPLFIIEGEEDLYSLRNINSQAIRGALAAITVSFNVPLITTKNSFDTAALIAMIAKREQTSKFKEVALHSQKPTITDAQLQEYIIASLPGVGPTLAKPLLEKFKTIKNIVNASLEQLQEVEKIGLKKAKLIKDILEKDYTP
ncbi:DEAD/DEAH box helicase [Candidatus Woesearchaeota archaeon]|nr:DEAD/DEAH box helicase [Candidatus Woesearchaeota archaeon]